MIVKKKITVSASRFTMMVSVATVAIIAVRIIAVVRIVVAHSCYNHCLCA